MTRRRCVQSDRLPMRTGRLGRSVYRIRWSNCRSLSTIDHHNGSANLAEIANYGSQNADWNRYGNVAPVGTAGCLQSQFGRLPRSRVPQDGLIQTRIAMSVPIPPLRPPVANLVDSFRHGVPVLRTSSERFSSQPLQTPRCQHANPWIVVSQQLDEVKDIP